MQDLVSHLTDANFESLNIEKVTPPLAVPRTVEVSPGRSLQHMPTD